MSSHIRRALGALILAAAALLGGYSLGNSPSTSGPAAAAIPEQNVTAPALGTTRILYSLDAKKNDEELIALINGAKTHVYFAVYEFTLGDVADALVAAKERGITVEGLVDRGEAATTYAKPIMAELRSAGIPIEEEHHKDGKGIMHIKALVTDSAYAMGSYNWTDSATNENDELLEIGTDPNLVAAYTSILQKLIVKYK